MSNYRVLPMQGHKSGPGCRNQHLVPFVINLWPGKGNYFFSWIEGFCIGRQHKASKNSLPTAQ